MLSANEKALLWAMCYTKILDSHDHSLDPEREADGMLKAINHRLPEWQEEHEDWYRSHVNNYSQWYSTEDRPLAHFGDDGSWATTLDGSAEFMAAVSYRDSKRPEQKLWWIRHCVIEDERGLCVVGDSDNEVAGWEIADVAYWCERPQIPTS